MQLPVVSPGDAKYLVRALRDFGFVYVKNHNVTTQNVIEQSNHFFRGSDDSKNKILMRGMETGFRGFQRIGQNVTQGQKDYHEGFDFMRSDISIGSKIAANENLWPDDPIFKKVMEDYISDMLSLGSILMESITVGLACEENVPRLNRSLFNDPFWLVRSIYYPKSDRFELGCGQHTDYGLLTMIAQEDVSGCLEIQKDRQWIPVEPLKDCLIVNIGDVLQFWTQGYFTATSHRVVSPQGRSRLSVPFFYEPNYDAVIRENGLTYGKHLEQKCYNNFISSSF